MMLRRLLFAALVALAPSCASAQIAMIAPTAPGSANNNQIATTAWVKANGTGSSPCSAFGTAAGTCAQGGVITAGGPTGSATVAPIITYNAAGQLTAVTSATITPAIGSVTGLGTGIATALGTNVGTAGAPVVNGGALGTPSSGTLTNATGLPTTGLTGTLQAAQFPALTGDITTSAGALATTLATVNSNVGTFGSATSCITTTVNGKGLVTAMSAATCAPAVGSVTGLGTGVATALGVNVGTDGAFVVKGGALGSPSSVGTMPAFTLGGTVSGGGNQINNVIIGNSTPLAGSFTSLAATSETITSTSSNAFAVGPSGTTTPSFNVDASTASAATGINVKSAAAGSGAALSVISSGTNERLDIDGKGSGNVRIAFNGSSNFTLIGNSGVQFQVTSSTGDVTGHGNQTYTQASGAMTLSYTGSAGQVQVSYVGSSGAVYFFKDTAAGADLKFFELFSSGGATSLKSLTDAGAVKSTFMSMDHSAGGVAFPTSTASTSSTTGAVVVTGGLGVGGSIYSAASVLSTGATSGIGYATGAGGAVTQATSRTTGVTLNTVTGAITLVSAAGSASFQSFTLTNSTIAATDVVRVTQKSGTDKYQIWVTNTAAGSCQITFATISGTTTEQPVFNFAVIKGVTS